jgi:hypothetical protein
MAQGRARCCSCSQVWEAQTANRNRRAGPSRHTCPRTHVALVGTCVGAKGAAHSRHVQAIRHVRCAHRSMSGIACVRAART